MLFDNHELDSNSQFDWVVGSVASILDDLVKFLCRPNVVVEGANGLTSLVSRRDPKAHMAENTGVIVNEARECYGL